MPSEEIPEPWNSFLKELDGTLSAELRLHCMGGFVVSILYGFSRTTSDLDVLVIVTKDERYSALFKLGGRDSTLYKKYGVYLDCVTVSKVPDSYDERLTEMFPGKLKHLRLFAFDPYDLALSKLERNEQRDRDDVKYLAQVVPLDLAVLRERYHKELRPYLGRPDREDLTLNLWIEAIEEKNAGEKP
ncbi:MAG: DUF6036 family nucleotidyltransferase [Terriglobales bacterium]